MLFDWYARLSKRNEEVVGVWKSGRTDSSQRRRPLVLKNVRSTTLAHFTAPEVNGLYRWCGMMRRVKKIC